MGCDVSCIIPQNLVDQLNIGGPVVPNGNVMRSLVVSLTLDYSL